MRAQPSLFVALLATSLTTTAIGQEWSMLFDGKTFSGWEGNRDVFRIEAGAIVGGSLTMPVAQQRVPLYPKDLSRF